MTRALLNAVQCRGNKHLQPLLGVAWDCGAVTTGPVTVPVLLSLGVGVMDAQRQKRAAQAALEDAALKKSEGVYTQHVVGRSSASRSLDNRDADQC
jgi:hypothetical protein